MKVSSSLVLVFLFTLFFFWPQSVFFLGQEFLPEGTEIIGYREILEISLIFQMS
jgi:hypothetical protein